jgi:transposase InsO family protein
VPTRVRSVGQVARDFDLTETAVREWVKQAERDAGTRGRYGAPRVHAVLRAQGRRHSRKRVARLMRAEGLPGPGAKRWKKTTIPDPGAAARADRIRRDFTADTSKLNTRWCGDVTYIATWEGWLYLATVIDIAPRRVVGYALADHLRTELISDALSNAVAARSPEPGVIFHSDRGSTPQPRTPPSPTTARWSSRPGGPVNAGTTPWPRASSPR